MQNVYWIYTTWPDRQAALEAATTLVTEKLCACTNILAPMTSVYRWQGKVETAEETPMVLKAGGDAINTLRARLVDLHRYDEPCFLALEVDMDASADTFLDWVRTQSAPGD